MHFRSLFIGLAALAILYSALWYSLALDAKKAVSAELRELRDSGLQVAFSDPEIAGFPYRMTLQIDRIKVTSKRKGIHVSLANAQLISHLWTPGDWMLLGDELDFALAKNSLKIKDNDIRGRWTLKEAAWIGSIELNGATIFKAPGIDDAATVERFEVHVMREIKGNNEANEREGLYGEKVISFSVRVANLKINASNKITLKQGEVQGSLIGAGISDWTKDSLSDWRDDGGLLEIEALAAKWRGTEISGSGSLTLDHRLKPMGSFGVGSTNIALLLDQLHKEGWGKAHDIKQIQAEMAASNINNLSLNLQNGDLRLDGYKMTELPIILR